MNNNLSEKVIVITGASSGIGEAMAKKLGEIGAMVVLGARREERLKDIVNHIKNQGGEATYAVTDVTVRGDLEHLVATALDQHGTLDVMINNAGISRLSRIDELDVEGWEQMIDVNLKGVLYGMAAAIPVFQKQSNGHIINIVSTAGIKISPMMGIYAATKNAVRTLTEAFRQESDGSIRITGISPGFVNTNLANSISEPEIRNAIQHRMQEIAITPDDIAHTVAFAMSQPKDVEIGEKEKNIIISLFHSISDELNRNMDDFSQDILVSQLEQLLNFSNRFYNRQFITREGTHNELISQLERFLSDYFNGSNPLMNGLPAVKTIADDLHISPHYLSDMLRSLTGQNTQQHIHAKLIEKAKEKLSTTELSISEIAYDLGFEHSQSFSKLFKNKTDCSPSEFRQSFN